MDLKLTHGKSKTTSVRDGETALQGLSPNERIMQAQNKTSVVKHNKKGKELTRLLAVSLFS